MKKIISIILSALLILAAFAGCGSSSSNNAQPAADASQSPATPAAAANDEASTPEVRTIVAATAGGPRPLIYTNDDGELDGHNVALLKAVFDLLPQYKLELIQASDLGSILTGVNSGIYQLGFNNLAKNADREKLVHYTDPIMVNDYLIVINKDLNIEFNGLESLVGLTMYGSAGNDKTTLVEDWNEEHPDQQININYASIDIVTSLQDVEAGRVDFTIIDAPMFNGYYQPEYNIDVDTYSLKGRTSTKYSYFVVAYGDDQLYEDVNRALAEVFANGTSTAICQEYLFDDFTPGIADKE